MFRRKAAKHFVDGPKYRVRARFRKIHEEARKVVPERGVHAHGVQRCSLSSEQHHLLGMKLCRLRIDEIDLIDQESDQVREPAFEALFFP